MVVDISLDPLTPTTPLAISISYAEQISPRNIWMYRGAWGYKDVLGAFRHIGGPNIQGVSRCTGDI